MSETVMTLPYGFARRMVDWQRLHGRQSLPWQNTQDPYRVWLSEIMLQQTQVSTVLDYFPRFLKRFPNVAALADAPQDDVCWRCGAAWVITAERATCTNAPRR
jgi:A/G-specific adenine glycosylase